MFDLLAQFKAVYSAHVHQPAWRVCVCELCVAGARRALQDSADEGLRAYARGVLDARWG